MRAAVPAARGLSHIEAMRKNTMDSPVQTGFAATDDGVKLYFRSIGSGPPMICCNGVGVSTFFWKYIVEHYSPRFQVIVWDYRGHGRSSSPADLETADLTMQRNAQDLQCVLNALEIEEPVILLGHSMGCQVILEYCQTHPSRCRALIPMFGTFAKPLDTFMNFRYSRWVFEVVRRVAEAGGRPGRRLLRPLFANPLGFSLGRRTGLVDRHYARREDIGMYMEHMNQMDQTVFFRMVSLMADHDLTDFLPRISIPVLVFAAEKDLFTPINRAREMARLIPEADLMVLAEASHAAIVEHPVTINHRIDRFLAERLQLNSITATEDDG